MKYYTHHENPRWKKVLGILAECPNGCSTQHIATCLNWRLEPLRSILHRMHDRGICDKKGRAWYPRAAEPVLSYTIKTWDDYPNSIGLVVTGVVPPTDNGLLANSFIDAIFALPVDIFMLYASTKKVHIAVNNDPKAPKDELFLKITFEFNVTDAVAKGFIPVAERFIENFYQNAV